MPITARCVARQRFTLARASILIAPRWQVGWERPASCSHHWSMHCASKIHADDTTVPVFAPGNGKTRTGRLWTYVRDERTAGENTPPAGWFAYTPDRKAERSRQHRKNFKGAVQADAYAEFHHLYGGGDISFSAISGPRFTYRLAFSQLPTVSRREHSLKRLPP